MLSVYFAVIDYTCTSYLTSNMFSWQHAMVIDTRNSSILPRKGALLKINQVWSCSSRFHTFSCFKTKYNFKTTYKTLLLFNWSFYGLSGTGRLLWGRCLFLEGRLWDSTQQDTLLGLSKIPLKNLNSFNIFVLSFLAFFHEIMGEKWAILWGLESWQPLALQLQPKYML